VTSHARHACKSRHGRRGTRGVTSYARPRGRTGLAGRHGARGVRQAPRPVAMAPGGAGQAPRPVAMAPGGRPGPAAGRCGARGAGQARRPVAVAPGGPARPGGRSLWRPGGRPGPAAGRYGAPRGRTGPACRHGVPAPYAPEQTASPRGPPPPARASHTARTEPGRILQPAAHFRHLQARVQLRRRPAAPAFPIAGGRSVGSGAAGAPWWEATWELGCIVGESGVEWGTRMVMHRGTRVAGLLPPSHPGSDFVTDA